jgi:hypothetical protein
MFWRYLDKDHPAVRDVPQDQKPRVIQDLYDRMDTLSRPGHAADSTIKPCCS